MSFLTPVIPAPHAAWQHRNAQHTTRTGDALAGLFAPYFPAEGDRETALLAGFDVYSRLIFWAESKVPRRGEAAFDPRDMRALLGHGQVATAVVAHNHPSGICAPSEADMAFTQHLSALCRACGLRLHDHLIYARDYWYSFRDNGLI